MKNAYEPVTATELKTITGPRPGCVAFNDVVCFVEHQHGVYPAGIYNRRNVRGVAGPIRPGSASLHSAGRAVDIGIPTKAVGDALFQKLLAAADFIGICEIIWWDTRTTTKGTLNYKGADNHHTHIHVGFTADFASRANNDDLKKWIAHFLYGA